MKKKWLALMLVVVMALGSLAGCGSEDASKEGDSKSTDVEKIATDDSGKVVNIWCWNDEFQSRFEKYMPGYDATAKTLDGVKINFIQTPNENNAYQTKLDEALTAQDTASADDKIDIFLMEMDYVAKYTNMEYSLPVASLGITDADLANMYTYTKEAGSSKDGVLKAISWQGCPGGYIYRRSIAKEVLGTDDPEKVQEAVADWDTFTTTAQTMKDKGYFMVSGFDDTYRVFANNVSQPWVDDSNKLQMDESTNKWIAQTKDYTDKGYNQKSTLWDTVWSGGMQKNAKVFGYFMPSWGIAFSMKEASLDDKALKDSDDATIKASDKKGSYGDWAVTVGPQSFNWGGSFLAACKGTDNTTLVTKIMKTMTTDKEVLKKITTEQQDFVNNKVANQELVAEGYKSGFLGDQAVTQVLSDAAEKITAKCTSAFDQGINESIALQYKDYFLGKVDEATAKANFFKAVKEKYAEVVTE